MIACYDLNICPASYDVVAFLTLAEVERAKMKDHSIDIHILPGPVDGFRRDGLWPFSTAERLQMLREVVIPMCEMLPSMSSLTVHDDRPPELLGMFGAGQYLISLDNILRGLRNGCRPLRVPSPLPPYPMVTITLREADHYPLRNSRVEQWMEAGNRIQARGFEVVFIRDTLRADDKLGPYLTSPGASRNLKERAGLYRRAYLNLGVSNGPMWFAVALDARLLMMRPSTEGAGGPFDIQFMTEYGLPPGEQLPTSPPYQRLVWQDDTAENIINAFDSMVPSLV